jgi:hypothetical protein
LTKIEETEEKIDLDEQSEKYKFIQSMFDFSKKQKGRAKANIKDEFLHATFESMIEICRINNLIHLYRYLTNFLDHSLEYSVSKGGNSRKEMSEIAKTFNISSELPENGFGMSDNARKRFKIF